jgi:hypothetical protein
MNRLRTAAAAITTAGLIFSMGACSDDEKPKPQESSAAATSATPSTPTVSPPPSEGLPQLTPAQGAAYKAAVAKFDEYQSFVDEVSADPRVTKERAKRLAGLVSTMEAASDFSDSIEQLISNGARTEGRREVAWDAAASATETKVVFKRCEKPGSWVLIGKDGQRSPQVENSLSEVTVVKVKGRWLVEDNKVVGRC